MKKLFGFFIPIIFLIVIIYPFALFFEYVLTEKEVDIVIMRIEETTTEDGQYLSYIYTTTEKFINMNNHFHKKTNAEELTKKFKAGESYKVTVVGYNFGIKLPFFLKERNIINIIEDDDIIHKFRKF